MTPMTTPRARRPARHVSSPRPRSAASADPSRREISNPTSDARVMMPKPPTWISARMTTWPKPDQYTGVSTTISPVTHTALVAVNSAVTSGSRARPLPRDRQHQQSGAAPPPRPRTPPRSPARDGETGAATDPGRDAPAGPPADRARRNTNHLRSQPAPTLPAGPPGHQLQRRREAAGAQADRLREGRTVVDGVYRLASCELVGRGQTSAGGP